MFIVVGDRPDFSPSPAHAARRAHCDGRPMNTRMHQSGMPFGPVLQKHALFGHGSIAPSFRFASFRSVFHCQRRSHVFFYCRPVMHNNMTNVGPTIVVSTSALGMPAICVRSPDQACYILGVKNWLSTSQIA